MATVEFKIEGLDEFIALLNQAKKELPKAIEATLYQFAEEVMADSKADYVPVDTGALMNTGKVMPLQTDNSSCTVELGYGDESVGYAAIVHEELMSPKGNPINWTRPGSGPKYLSRPLEAKQDQLPQRIIDAVTKVFT